MIADLPGPAVGMARWPRLVSGILTAVLLLVPAPLSAAAAGRYSSRNPLVTLISPVTGERTLEAQEVRFVYFRTRYRESRAPRSESATGQRLEVVDDRKECRCIRRADYSRIKMSQIRELAFDYPSGSRIASVRVTTRDGRVNQFPVTALFGGDGLFPPRCIVTTGGIAREYPLALEGEAPVDWPEELPARMLLLRLPPPPTRKSRPPRS